MSSLAGGSGTQTRSLVSFVRCVVALALVFAASLACAQANPRLASLGLEIWPEFDRPSVLVILRGVIAPDVKLPARVSVRLPSTAVGPMAVAHSTSADGSLLTLNYDQASTGADTTLTFDAPDRFFHVEFYDPLATGDAARTYRYTWPGDFVVDRATVVVQEPASAQSVITHPELKEVSSGAAGLNYRAGDLGALGVGKAVPITVRYTKADARPSVDIKGLRTTQPAEPSSAPVQAAPAPPAAIGTSLPMWVLPMAAFAALAVLGVLLVLFMWRRQSAPGSAAFCTKCGAALPPASRFCGKCGAKVTAKGA